MADSIKIPVSLEVLQSSIRDVEQAAANIKVDSEAWRNLQGILHKLRSEADSLAVAIARPFSTQSQFNNAQKSLSKINDLLGKVSITTSRITFKDLQLTPQQETTFKDLEKQVRDIENEITKFKSQLRQQLTAQDSDISKDLIAIDPNIVSKSFDEIIKIVEKKTKTIENEKKAAEATLQSDEYKQAQKRRDATAKFLSDGMTRAGMGDQGYEKVFNIKGNLKSKSLMVEWAKENLTLPQGELDALLSKSTADVKSYFENLRLNPKDILSNADKQVKLASNGAPEAIARYEALQRVLKVLSDASSQLQTKQESLAGRLQNAKDKVIDFQNGAVRAAQTTKTMGNAQAAVANQTNALSTALSQCNQQWMQMQRTSNTFNSIRNAIVNFMGFNQVLNLTKNAVKNAMNHIKDLDSVMNKISIVTNMSTADLWNQVDAYSDMARTYGVSIKGAYEVSQIYYQQGLQTADVLTLTNETLKLAKISGLDYAKTTDYMTTALRGFKMEMSEASTVVDVYSALAAHTAVSQEELAVAMSKTASSMEGVGTTFQEASSMIGTMVAVTRESATNIGTALKSIASRYGELTKDPNTLVDEDGQALAFNKVDAALQSVGITMRTVDGQFRSFTDVIIELGEKWDQLDSTQQRYIATQFAGNRQQSRFLALVSNVDMLKSNLDVAMNSEDTGTLQALKALDSIESKIEQVKVSYQQFYTTIGAENIWKGALDGIKNYIDMLNGLPKLFGKLPIGAIAMVAQLVQVFRGLGDLIVTHIAKVWQSVTPNTDFAKDIGANVGKGVAQGITDSSDVIMTALSKALSGVGTQVQGSAQAAVANAAEQGIEKSNIKESNEQGQQLSTPKALKDNNFDQQLKKEITKESIDLSQVSTLTDQNINKVITSINSTSPQVITAFAQMGRQASTEFLKELVTNMGAGNADYAERFADEFAKGFEGAAQNNFKNILTQGLSDIQIDPNQAGKSLDAIKNALKGQSSELQALSTSLGSDVVQSIVMGILSGGGEATQSIQELGKNLIDALRSGLDTHSPSPTIIAIVKMAFGESVGIGIAESIDQAMQGGKSLGEALVDALQQTLDSQKINGTQLQNGLKIITDQAKEKINDLTEEESAALTTLPSLSHFTTRKVFNKEQALDKKVNENQMVAVHNMPQQYLDKTLQWGAVPAPSIALRSTKSEAWTDYGEISLFPDQFYVTPDQKNATVYSGDAQTPMLRTEVESLSEALQEISFQYEHSGTATNDQMLYSDLNVGTLLNMVRIPTIEQANKMLSYAANLSPEEFSQKKQEFDNQFSKGQQDIYSLFSKSQFGTQLQNWWGNVGGNTARNEALLQTLNYIKEQEANPEANTISAQQYYINQLSGALTRNKIGLSSDEINQILSSESGQQVIDQELGLLQGIHENPLISMLESKSQVAIPIGSMLAAMIPNNTSQEQIAKLISQGLDQSRIFEYDPKATEGPTSRAAVYDQIVKSMPYLAFNERRATGTSLKGKDPDSYLHGVNPNYPIRGKKQAESIRQSRKEVSEAQEKYFSEHSTSTQDESAAHEANAEAIKHEAEVIKELANAKKEEAESSKQELSLDEQYKNIEEQLTKNRKEYQALQKELTSENQEEIRAAQQQLSEQRVLLFQEKAKLADQLAKQSNDKTDIEKYQSAAKNAREDAEGVRSSLKSQKDQKSTSEEADNRQAIADATNQQAEAQERLNEAEQNTVDNKKLEEISGLIEKAEERVKRYEQSVDTINNKLSSFEGKKELTPEEVIEKNTLEKNLGPALNQYKGALNRLNFLKQQRDDIVNGKKLSDRMRNEDKNELQSETVEKESVLSDEAQKSFSQDEINNLKDKLKAKVANSKAFKGQKGRTAAANLGIDNYLEEYIKDYPETMTDESSWTDAIKYFTEQGKKEILKQNEDKKQKKEEIKKEESEKETQKLNQEVQQSTTPPVINPLPPNSQLQISQTAYDRLASQITSQHSISGYTNPPVWPTTNIEPPKEIIKVATNKSKVPEDTKAKEDQHLAQEANASKKDAGAENKDQKAIEQKTNAINSEADAYRRLLQIRQEIKNGGDKKTLGEERQALVNQWGIKTNLNNAQVEKKIKELESPIEPEKPVEVTETLNTEPAKQQDEALRKEIESTPAEKEVQVIDNIAEINESNTNGENGLSNTIEEDVEKSKQALTELQQLEAEYNKIKGEGAAQAVKSAFTGEESDDVYKQFLKNALGKNNASYGDESKANPEWTPSQEAIDRSNQQVEAERQRQEAERQEAERLQQVQKARENYLSLIQAKQDAGKIDENKAAALKQLAEETNSVEELEEAYKNLIFTTYEMSPSGPPGGPPNNTNNNIEETTSRLQRLKDAFKDTKTVGKFAQAIGTGLSTVTSFINTTTLGGEVAKKSIMAIGGAVSTVGAILSHAGPTAYISAAITAVSSLISLIQTFSLDAQIERAEKKAEELVTESKKAKAEYKTLDKGLEKLEKLKEERYESAEAAEEYQTAVDELAEQFPQLISGFDEAGNVMINTTSAEAVLADARERSAKATYDAAQAELTAAQLKATKAAENADVDLQEYNAEQATGAQERIKQAQDYTQDIQDKTGVGLMNFKESLLNWGNDIKGMAEQMVEFLGTNVKDKRYDFLRDESLYTTDENGIISFNFDQLIANLKAKSEAGELTLEEKGFYDIFGSESASQLSLVEQYNQAQKEYNDLGEDATVEQRYNAFTKAKKAFEAAKDAGMLVSDALIEAIEKSFETAEEQLRDYADAAGLQNSMRRQVISAWQKTQTNNGKAWEYLEESSAAAALVTAQIDEIWAQYEEEHSGTFLVNKANYNQIVKDNAGIDPIKLMGNFWNRLNSSQQETFNKMFNDSKYFTTEDFAEEFGAVLGFDAILPILKSYYQSGGEQIHERLTQQIAKSFNVEPNEYGFIWGDAEGIAAGFQHEFTHAVNTNYENLTIAQENYLNSILGQYNKLKKEGYSQKAEDFGTSAINLYNQIAAAPAKIEKQLWQLIEENGLSTVEGITKIRNIIKGNAELSKYIDTNVLDILEGQVIPNINLSIQTVLDDLITNWSDTSKTLSSAMSGGVSLKEADDLIQKAKTLDFEGKKAINIDDFILNGDKLILTAEAYDRYYTATIKSMNDRAFAIEEDLTEVAELNVKASDFIVDDKMFRRRSSATTFNSNYQQYKEALDSIGVYQADIEKAFTEGGQEAVQKLIDDAIANAKEQSEYLRKMAEIAKEQLMNGEKRRQGIYSYAGKDLNKSELESLIKQKLGKEDYTGRAIQSEITSVYSTLISDMISKGAENINLADYDGLIASDEEELKKARQEAIESGDLTNFIKSYAGLANKTTAEIDQLLAQAIETKTKPLTTTISELISFDSTTKGLTETAKETLQKYGIDIDIQAENAVHAAAELLATLSQHIGEAGFTLKDYNAQAKSVLEATLNNLGGKDRAALTFASSDIDASAFETLANSLGKQVNELINVETGEVKGLLKTHLSFNKITGKFDIIGSFDEFINALNKEFDLAIQKNSKAYIEALKAFNSKINKDIVDDVKEKLEKSSSDILKDFTFIDSNTVETTIDGLEKLSNTFGVNLNELINRYFSYATGKATVSISDLLTNFDIDLTSINTFTDTLQDTIDSMFDNLTKLISSGIEGKLSRSDVRSLQKLAKEQGIEGLSFTRTKDGWKIAEESLMTLYSTLEDMDSISAQITLDKLNESEERATNQLRAYNTELKEELTYQEALTAMEDENGEKIQQLIASKNYNGNVDLLHRPKVYHSDGSYSTLLTSTHGSAEFDTESQWAMNITAVPVIKDANGNIITSEKDILSEDQINEYIESIIKKAGGEKASINDILKADREDKSLILELLDASEDYDRTMASAREHAIEAHDISAAIENQRSGYYDKFDDTKISQYEKELELNREIMSIRATTESDDFKFMDKNIPSGQNNPLNYWESWGKAMKAIQESTKGDENNKGYMGYQDFYNIITEMGQLADASGQITIGGKEVLKNSEDAAKLIERAAGALSVTADGSIKVDLSKLGIDFATGADTMNANIQDGINQLADSQIEMLDSMIQLMETIVAMEKLKDIDVDSDNEIDLGEIFKVKYDERGFQLYEQYWDEFTDNFKSVAERILKDAESNKDLEKALKSVKANGITLHSMFEDALDGVKDLNIDAQAYTAIMDAFYKAAISGDYNLNNIMSSIREVLAGTNYEGTIEVGDMKLTFKQGVEIITDENGKFLYNGKTFDSEDAVIKAAHSDNIDAFADASKEYNQKTGQVEYKINDDYKAVVSYQYNVDTKESTYIAKFNNGGSITANSKQALETGIQLWLLQNDTKVESSTEAKQSKVESGQSQTFTISVDGKANVTYNIEVTNDGVEFTDGNGNKITDDKTKEQLNEALKKSSNITGTIGETVTTEFNGTDNVSPILDTLLGKIKEFAELCSNIVINFSTSQNPEKGFGTPEENIISSAQRDKLKNSQQGSSQILDVKLNVDTTPVDELKSTPVELPISMVTSSLFSSLTTIVNYIKNSYSAQLPVSADTQPATADINNFTIPDTIVKWLNVGAQFGLAITAIADFIAAIPEDNTAPQLPIDANTTAAETEFTQFKSSVENTPINAQVTTNINVGENKVDEALGVNEANANDGVDQNINIYSNKTSEELISNINNAANGVNQNINNTSNATGAELDNNVTKAESGVTQNINNTDNATETALNNNVVKAETGVTQNINNTSNATEAALESNVDKAKTPVDQEITNSSNATGDALTDNAQKAVEGVIQNINISVNATATALADNVKWGKENPVVQQIVTEGGSANNSSKDPFIPENASENVQNKYVHHSTGNVGLANAAGTLMGELGPELVVSNGHYFVVGQNGAEFVDLADDAIVFNHIQTEQLLKNGMSPSRGKAVTSERNAISFASGNVNGGAAMASASQALAALKQLRAMWESLKKASVKDLAGKGGGGGGGGGGKTDTPERKAWIEAVERWYNLMQKIAQLERDITHEEALRTKLQGEFQKNGRAYYASQKRTLQDIEKQSMYQMQLNISQEEYFNQRRKALNESQFNRLYTFDENGTIQYNDSDLGFAWLSDLVARDEYGNTKYTNEEQYNRIVAEGYGAYMQQDSSGALIEMEKDENGELKEDQSAFYAKAIEAWWDTIDGQKEEMESLKETIDEGKTKVLELESQRNEILKEIRDNQMKVEDNVLKAIESSRQSEIDALSKERQALQDASTKYIEGLNNALNKERQMYEQQENAEELNRKRRQLDILRRSGGSGSQIRSLENEIQAGEKESYFTQQQNQIDAIKEASDLELERLDQQIEIMTQTLEYQKEMGLLWGEVEQIMELTPEQITTFIMEHDSEMWDDSPLKTEEQFQQAMFEAEQWRAFAEDANNIYNQSIVNHAEDQATMADAVYGGGADYNWGLFNTAMRELYGEQWEAVASQFKGTFMSNYSKTGDITYAATEVTNALNNIGSQMTSALESSYNAYKQAAQAKAAEESGGGGGGGGGGSGSGGSGGETKLENVYSSPQSAVYDVLIGDNVHRFEDRQAAIDYYNLMKRSPYAVSKGITKRGFKQGGMVDFTGLTMVHGTSNKPESVLNARQTEILRNDILGSKPTSLMNLLLDFRDATSGMATDSDYNSIDRAGLVIENASVNMNVQKIANDYDAQRAGEQALQEMVRIARKTSAKNSVRR